MTPTISNGVGNERRNRLEGCVAVTIDATTVPFRPNKTGFAIMQLVHGYFARTRKPWTLMSQAWMLEKLEAWHGVRISRSTLNYNLAILERNGLVERVTRHKRDGRTGEFVPQVTLYKMTKALKRFFSRLAMYYERCDWVPDVRVLAAGIVPAVGKVKSAYQAAQEYVAQLRRDREERRRRRRKG